MEKAIDKTLEDLEQARLANDNKAKERAEKINNMSEKERYEYYKNQTQARKEKLKLLKTLQADVNKKIMFPDEEVTEETHLELLQQLQDIEHQIIAIKKNKNNSYYFSYTPSKGFNRKQRRSL